MSFMTHMLTKADDDLDQTLRDTLARYQEMGAIHPANQN